MSTIDAYLAELADALHGHRRLKADLLAEARGSLLDATDAYVAQGLNRYAAQVRAIDEFGTVAQIAPRYQAELGVSQGRRTALLMFFVLGTQHLVFGYLWSSLPADSPSPGAGYAAMASLVDHLSLAIICCALIGAIGCGIGSRYIRPDRLVASIGRLGLATVALWLVAGTLLSIFSPIERFGADARYLWLHAASAFVLAVITRSAWRCLRCARLPSEPRDRTVVL